MSAPAKVLVVDDTPNNVKLLSDVLAVRGYAVTTAASGEEALARIASDPPDLVLLDVMMPGLSGYDVCRRIRADALTALLPVVLVTALDPDQERVKGIEAGADDFLTKPINQGAPGRSAAPGSGVAGLECETHGARERTGRADRQAGPAPALLFAERRRCDHLG
jgi:CheY-like chemotaxis protein